MNEEKQPSPPEPAAATHAPTPPVPAKSASVIDGAKSALPLVGMVGVLVAVCNFVYGIGKDAGAKDCQAQLDRQGAANEKDLAKADRTLAIREDESRQCTVLNAQLQAMLKLSDADRLRLLEIASSEAPVSLMIQGRRAEGSIIAPTNAGGCLLLRLDFENTGSRDVVPAYMNIVTPIEFFSDPVGTTHSAGERFRTEVSWGDLLAPGGTRTINLELCSTPPPSSAVPVELTLLSAGFQAKRFKFTLSPKPK